MANARVQDSPATTRRPTTTTPGGSAARTVDVIALVLMIVGGINWGLVGLFQFDLVATLFGQMSAASRVVYVLVGLAALYGIVTAVRVGRRQI
jgi:uncharacterized membrane protein YuzA (DUF378 family)